MAEIAVRIGSREDAIRVRESLADTSSALASIGAIIVAQAQTAFTDQRLGTAIWPPRYPAQRAPFLNIAPVVRNAGAGRPPRADDFRDRPALGGARSELYSSISASVTGGTVEIGTNHEGAALMQYGGLGTIPITDRTRDVLAEWLGISGTKQARGGRVRLRGKEYTEGTRAQYAEKLAFVFDPDRTEMKQRALSRPFIGWTEQTMTDVLPDLAEWLGGEVTL